jgi:hypothetical protein
MRARFGERHSRADYKREKIQPFVIFCLHQGEDLAARNPQFTCGELTSTLGAMWRELPALEKQEYVVIAQREAVDPTPPWKRQRRIAMEEREAANARDSGPGNEPERVFTFARPPCLWVIPAGRLALRRPPPARALSQVKSRRPPLLVSKSHPITWICARGRRRISMASSFSREIK